MSKPEPGWERRPGALNVFTRPLLGMELWCDQTMRLENGMTQLAIGIQFTTTIHERDLEARLKEAVVRLRFECPLVAATIEPGIHHPEFGSWLYTPLLNVDAARAWADNTAYYLPGPIQDPASFLQFTVEEHKIPYILADNSEQYLRVYLTRPDSTLNTYFLSLHASHSIIDARPGLNAQSLLLEWMTTLTESSVSDLAWGTEHKNLPPGPITVTGGPREDWSTNGIALVERFLAASSDQTPSHGLHCDISRAKEPVRAHRLFVKFTAEESTRIGRALKALGFTFSELIDAAAIVAAFEQNPIPADKADTACMKGASIIAITDRLDPANVDRRRHLVSCVACAPYRLAYAPLAPLAGRARQLAAMRQMQAHYASWLANPCLPHLHSELGPRIAPSGATRTEAQAPWLSQRGSGTYAPGATNVGRVENYVAPVWPRGPGAATTTSTTGSGGCRPGGAAVVRVEEMHLASRMGHGCLTPVVHAWSIQGRLSILLQASGVWDKDVLQDFMNGIVKQIAFIIME